MMFSHKILFLILLNKMVTNTNDYSYCIEDIKDTKLLIIMVDGFRWDYVSRLKNLKGFPRMAQNGVHVEYVRPVFPVKSQPNWYTITTGLYPESHGILQNHMYDIERKQFFVLSPEFDKTQSHWWNKTEPLWINAERHGIRTSMYLWDGCQAKIKGLKASYCYQNKGYFKIGTDFDSTEKEFRNCLKLILGDFHLNKYRLSFLYYELTDQMGHDFGPDSENLTKAVILIDTILNDVFGEIISSHLDQTLNVVVLSDHGMTDLKGFQRVFLQKSVDFNDVEVMLGWGSSTQILPKPGKLEVVYNQLSKIEGIIVYKKQDIPEQLHYRNNKRVLPILVRAKYGYHIQPPQLPQEKLIPQPKPDADDSIPLNGGNHGYDQNISDMFAIMYAMGPAFKKNFKSGPIEMVDHYNIFCKILGLKAHPNNGSFDRVKNLLKHI